MKNTKIQKTKNKQKSFILASGWGSRAIRDHIRCLASFLASGVALIALSAPSPQALTSECSWFHHPLNTSEWGASISLGVRIHI